MRQEIPLDFLTQKSKRATMVLQPLYGTEGCGVVLFPWSVIMAVVKDNTVVVCWTQFEVWIEDELWTAFIKEVFSPLNRWGAGIRYGSDPTEDQMVQHYLLEKAHERLLKRLRPVHVRQDRRTCDPYSQSPK